MFFNDVSASGCFLGQREFTATPAGSRQAGRNCCVQCVDGRRAARRSYCLTKTAKLLTCWRARLNPTVCPPTSRTPSRLVSGCLFFWRCLNFPHIPPPTYFHEGRRRWSARQPSLDLPGSGIRLLWHPSYFEGGDFFKPVINRRSVCYNRLTALGTARTWRAKPPCRVWNRKRTFIIPNCFEIRDILHSAETWPVRRGWVSANWLS